MTNGLDSEQLALLVHEVRSPVAALVAIAEAVADGVDRPSLRELARLALRACHSLDRIVGEAALGSLRREPVDLQRMLDDVAAGVKLEGGRVTVKVASPIVLEADPVRLRQALDNLVRNALTHSGTTSDVLLSAHTDGETVVLAVADEGRGIEPDEQERIFAAGTRLDLSREGLGLGLAVVRAVVEAHGGEVSLESTPGRGATFTMRLPLGATRQASP